MSYTYHSLEPCVKLADTVRQIGNGRQAVSRSLLASNLGIDEQSGDFAQRIASSKTFGLLDGKSELTLTEAAREYFFPTGEPDAVKKAQLLKFLVSPGAFQALVDQFDGSKPPSSEIMGNVLGEKYGIPQSWKIRVAQFFIKSASFAGVIDVNGFLRYNAQTKATNGTNPPKPPLENDATDPGMVSWRYGKLVRVEVPENITIEIWERLNKYVQALKP